MSKMDQRRTTTSSVGDLVYIANPAAPQKVSPRYIIKEVFPGNDGRIRVVQVKTQLGSLKRSANVSNEI